MKYPAISRDLVPVHEFRSNLAEWLRRVDDTGRPVVVTQRGKAAAVLMHPAVLDELEEEKELVRKVLRGLRDVEEGALVDDDEVWDDVERVIAAAEKTGAGEVD